MQQVIPSAHSSDTDNFKVLSPDCPKPFLVMSTRKIFSQLSVNLHDLYEPVKNQLIPSVHS